MSWLCLSGYQICYLPLKVKIDLLLYGGWKLLLLKVNYCSVDGQSTNGA